MKDNYENLDTYAADNDELSNSSMATIIGLVIGGLTTMFSPSATMTSRVVTGVICAVEINSVVKKNNPEKDSDKSDLLAFSGGTVTGAVTGSLSNWLLGK